MQERNFAAVIEAQEDDSGAFADKSIGDEDIPNWKVCSYIIVCSNGEEDMCVVLDNGKSWVLAYSNSLCTFGLLHSHAPFGTHRCCGDKREGITQPQLFTNCWNLENNVPPRVNTGRRVTPAASASFIRLAGRS